MGYADHWEIDSLAAERSLATTLVPLGEGSFWRIILELEQPLQRLMCAICLLPVGAPLSRGRGGLVDLLLQYKS